MCSSRFPFDQATLHSSRCAQRSDEPCHDHLRWRTHCLLRCRRPIQPFVSVIAVYPFIDRLQNKTSTERIISAHAELFWISDIRHTGHRCDLLGLRRHLSFIGAYVSDVNGHHRLLLAKLCLRLNYSRRSRETAVVVLFHCPGEVSAVSCRLDVRKARASLATSLGWTAEDSGGSCGGLWGTCLPGSMACSIDHELLYKISMNGRLNLLNCAVYCPSVETQYTSGFRDIADLS